MHHLIQGIEVKNIESIHLNDLVGGHCVIHLDHMMKTLSTNFAV